ncbi:MAG: ATP-binding protein [Treponema sp.]|nr:ATP-binding protein [Treponema sp.]
MLSVRRKIILIIIGIVLFITGSTLGVGLLVSNFRFMDVVKTTLLSVSRMASGMLSSEIGRLKEEASLIAEQVGMAGGDLQAVLNEKLTRHPSYLSFSVVELEGVTVHAGDPDTKPVDYDRSNSYARRAFAGETVITSTLHTPRGGLVMRIWAPAGTGRVFVATLPGLHLSEFLLPYGIWETSSIFVLDQRGAHIAGNRYHYRIQERREYIEWGRQHPGGHRQVHRTISEYDEGVERFEFSGRQQFTAFHSIQGTDNWSVAVVAPLAETPLFQVRKVLLAIALAIIIIGIIATIFAAELIAKPYEEMENLKTAAETASRSKTQFLANMSHEMRTPLSAIIGLSEMELGGTKLRGDSFANVEKIHGAGMTMLGIVNDILDISKIEFGKLSLVPVMYDVPNMINDTIQLNIIRLGSKPVRFRLSVNGDIPVRLVGDELRVKQIFNNLLSNAFKYTDDGSVEWSICCAREEDIVRITSTIRDTGIGIRREDQGKLFKDYSQVNVRANYYAGGTGLGLSITKRLVEMMGGSITVESDYLRGSSFTVEFLHKAAGDEVIGEDTAKNLSQFRYSAQRHVQNQDFIRANMSYARVLVVDDVPSNLDIAKGLLKSYKINVDTAESGGEAIDLVLDGKIRYDAIFMDHMMPGVNGMQAAKAIREETGNEYAKTIPIIAMTANALAGNDELYLRNGFQAFLSKPIDVLRLDQVLNQWVRNREKERGLPHLEANTGKSREEASRFLNSHTIPGLNLAQGFAVLQNDKNSYLAVLRSFVRHTPTKISVLKNSRGDSESYRIAVHGLRGSGKSIGAESLGAMADDMEKAAARGDRGYIRANNAAFVEAAEKLVADIAFFLEDVSADESVEEKPERERPDPEVLREILRACESYDMLGLRKAAESLDAFSYESFPDLGQWVTEQSHLSNFDAIHERVESIVGTLE